MEEQIPIEYIGSASVVQEMDYGFSDQAAYEKAEPEVRQASFAQNKVSQNLVQEESQQETAQNAIQGSIPSGAEKNASQNGISTGGSMDMSITVNGDPVVLKNKERYILVDVLDFYPVDTSVAHGDHLEMEVDGESCDFTHPLRPGAKVRIEWVD